VPSGFDTLADEPPVTSVTQFEPSSLNLVATHATINILHWEVSLNRRVALHSFLLLLIWASVACATKPTGENAEASATSHIFGSSQVTLPPGTAVTVRLSSAVGSKLSASGDHFSAIVARPVEVNGKVVVPAGAEALGRVVEAVPQGRFKGAAQLRRVLETVTLDKDSYDVQTSSVNRSLKGKGKRTATFIGGGAGGGALIGGLAGGGKGALIGAALGAGAGTAGAAYTGEKEIVLPAESALSFKLTEPVTIKM
jgi:hypothetical protein